MTMSLPECKYPGSASVSFVQTQAASGGQLVEEQWWPCCCRLDGHFTAQSSSMENRTAEPDSICLSKAPPRLLMTSNVPQMAAEPVFRSFPVLLWAYTTSYKPSPTTSWSRLRSLVWLLFPVPCLLPPLCGNICLCHLMMTVFFTQSSIFSLLVVTAERYTSQFLPLCYQVLMMSLSAVTWLVPLMGGQKTLNCPASSSSFWQSSRWDASFLSRVAVGRDDRGPHSACAEKRRLKSYFPVSGLQPAESSSTWSGASCCC